MLKDVGPWEKKKAKEKKKSWSLWERVWSCQVGPMIFNLFTKNAAHNVTWKLKIDTDLKIHVLNTLIWEL